MQPRTVVVQTIRHYFEAHHFEEVVPTLFADTIPTEPTIFPFVTEGHILATSPEAYLKKAMADGCGNCYAISPAFRNMEGSGRWHQPEFLMAEWYQKDASWINMIKQTQEVILLVCGQFNFATADVWPTISWIDLWQQYVGTNLTNYLDDTDMFEFARGKGYTTEGATWEQVFNQIALNEIEPHFSKEAFFLVDFPSRISPLAKPQNDNPGFAERFELLINRVELANGNTEYFNEPEIRKTIKGEPFLESLRALSLQQWAGVGLGIDRLAALITDSSVETIQRYE